MNKAYVYEKIKSSVNSFLMRFSKQRKPLCLDQLCITVKLFRSAWKNSFNSDIGILSIENNGKLSPLWFWSKLRLAYSTFKSLVWKLEYKENWISGDWWRLTVK